MLIKKCALNSQMRLITRVYSILMNILKPMQIEPLISTRKRKKHAWAYLIGNGQYTNNTVILHVALLSILSNFFNTEILWSY